MQPTRSGRVFDELASGYDRGNRLISMGQDLRWKRRAVTALGNVRDRPIVDAGAGTGDLSRMAAEAGARVLAIDVSAAMLGASRHASGVHPVQADAQRMPIPDGAAAGLVSGFMLRNVPSLAAFLSDAHRVLAPGARAALLEICYPDGPLRRRLFSTYFHGVVPFLGALATGKWGAYRYLSHSLRGFPSPETIGTMAEEAGFRVVTLARARWTGMFLIVLERPPAPG